MKKKLFFQSAIETTFKESIKSLLQKSVSPFLKSSRFAVYPTPGTLPKERNVFFLPTDVTVFTLEDTLLPGRLNASQFIKIQKGKKIILPRGTKISIENDSCWTVRSVKPVKCSGSITVTRVTEAGVINSSVPFDGFEASVMPGLAVSPVPLPRVRAETEKRELELVLEDVENS